MMHAHHSPIQPRYFVQILKGDFMKSLYALMFFTVLTLGLTSSAQGILSDAPGTPGELGVFAPSVDETVVLPENGILHYTTVNVPVGVTVTFSRPASGANPAAHILATGDIIIDGILDVSGENGTANSGGFGGPGGFSGGAPGNGVDIAPGPGQGPGGGNACPMTGGTCTGTFGRQGSGGSLAGNVYGTGLLVPLLAGSGGGGGASSSTKYSGGGGGGGGLLLASETRIQLSGSILARGGKGGYHTEGGGRCYWTPINHGSGGGIRIVAPVVEGTGTIDVTSCIYNTYSYGGYGRVRVDAIDRTGMAFTYQGNDGSTVVKNGTYLVAIPPPAQAMLSLVSIGGVATNGEATMIRLPFGTPPTQDVELLADGFSGTIDVTVRLTPSSGAPIETVLPGIDASSGSAAMTIPVTFPTNVFVKVRVWAKQN
ncbi:MAG: hypothetical protein GY822_21305 [Deltaproteobacteria bacterium]|nr:hypothetical protein [Deltaproteobacteria bacterium]